MQVTNVSIPANTAVSVQSATGWTLEGTLGIQCSANSVSLLIVDSLVSMDGLKVVTGSTAAPTFVPVNSDVFVRNGSGSAVSVAFLLTEGPSSGPISATFVY